MQNYVWWQYFRYWQRMRFKHLLQNNKMVSHPQIAWEWGVGSSLKADTQSIWSQSLGSSEGKMQLHSFGTCTHSIKIVANKMEPSLHNSLGKLSLLTEVIDQSSSLPNTHTHIHTRAHQHTRLLAQWEEREMRIFKPLNKDYNCCWAVQRYRVIKKLFKEWSKYIKSS